MKNKIIVAILSVIAIMVSIIAYIQIIPFIEKWQEEMREKQKMEEYGECVAEAKAEALPGEITNETKFYQCLSGIYDQ
jgi:hypothetical protein